MNHFETSENYYKLNQAHSTEFIKTRFYQTLQLATYDVCFSLLQFLSHRPKIAIIRQGSSVFELLIPIFLRQQTPIQFKSENQNVISFLSEIDKEINFVLWSAENEITGEIIYSDSQCQEIHKTLSDHRIFSIQITQSARLLNKTDILKNNYSIVIEAGGLFESDQTQIFFTDKLKAPTLIGAFQENKFNLIVKKTAATGFQLQKISEFQYSNLFQPSIKYLSDRHVFIFKNCSGQMLMQKLIEKTSINPNHIFAPSSLSTWVLDTFKNWWTESANPELILNMVVISNQAFILNSDLETQIQNTYTEIISATSWIIG